MKPSPTGGVYSGPLTIGTQRFLIGEHSSEQYLPTRLVESMRLQSRAQPVGDSVVTVVIGARGGGDQVRRDGEGGGGSKVHDPSAV